MKLDEKVQMHERIVSALEKSFSKKLEVLAYHNEQYGRSEDAKELYYAAAKEASSVKDASRAIQNYENFVRLASGFDQKVATATEKLGDLYASNGEFESALKKFNNLLMHVKDKK